MTSAVISLRSMPEDKNSIPARSLLMRRPIGIATLFELRNLFLEDRSIDGENFVSWVAYLDMLEQTLTR
jgi:hypothetical protein